VLSTAVECDRTCANAWDSLKNLTKFNRLNGVLSARFLRPSPAFARSIAVDRCRRHVTTVNGRYAP